MLVEFEIAGPVFSEGVYRSIGVTAFGVELKEIAAEDAPVAFSIHDRFRTVFRSHGGELWRTLQKRRRFELSRDDVAYVGLASMTGDMEAKWGAPTPDDVSVWQERVLDLLEANSVVIDGGVYVRSALPRVALSIDKDMMLDIFVAPGNVRDDHAGATTAPISDLPGLIAFRETLRGARRQLSDPPGVEFAENVALPTEGAEEFSDQTKRWVCALFETMRFGQLPASAIRAYVDLRQAEGAASVLPAVIRLANSVGYLPGARVKPWRKQYGTFQGDVTAHLLEALTLPCRRIEHFFSDVGDLQSGDMDALA